MNRILTPAQMLTEIEQLQQDRSISLLVGFIFACFCLAMIV